MLKGLLISHRASAESTHFQLSQNTNYVTYLSKSLNIVHKYVTFLSHRHQAKANKCELYTF